jgi:hypothetical protein
MEGLDAYKNILRGVTFAHTLPPTATGTMRAKASSSATPKPRFSGTAPRGQRPTASFTVI